MHVRELKIVKNIERENRNKIIPSSSPSEIYQILLKRLNFWDSQLAVQGGGKKVVWSWQPGREEIMILAVLD